MTKAQIVKEVTKLLDAWREWETTLIRTDSCWKGGYPTFNQELIDTYVDLQDVREMLTEKIQKEKEKFIHIPRETK